MSAASSYLDTVARARQRLAGPGAPPAALATALRKLLLGLDYTTTASAAELASLPPVFAGQALLVGRLTPARTARLRAAWQAHFDALATAAGSAVETHALAAASLPATAHATALAAVSKDAGRLASGVRLAARFDDIPRAALLFSLARQELGGAATYKGLAALGVAPLAAAVDQTLVAALATGASARATQKGILASIRAGLDEATPGVGAMLDAGARATSKGVKAGDEVALAARRASNWARQVAVSETNEAYRAASVLAALRSPVTSGVATWQRSGRHRSLTSGPCACDVLASADQHGLGRGRFYLSAWPPAPHPYCACTCVPEVRPASEWGTPKAGPAKDWQPKTDGLALDTEAIFAREAALPTYKGPPITPARIAQATEQVRRATQAAADVASKGAARTLAQQAAAGAQQAEAVLAALPALQEAVSTQKGSIAAMKAAVAQAKTLAKAARAAGHAEALQSVLAVMGEAESALAAKQAANAFTTAKAALKKKITTLQGKLSVEALAKAGAATPEALAALAAQADEYAAAATALGSKADDLHALATAAKEAAQTLASGGFPPSLSSLVVEQGLGGSTGAQLVRDAATGRRYVRKAGGNAAHLREEVLADEIYRAAGVDVPAVRLYETPTGPVKLAPWHVGKPLSAYEGTAEWTALRAQLQKDFALDALMGNWDVIGMGLDNVLVVKDEARGVLRVLRIDNGGALRHRAQGALKGTSWNERADELWSMRGRPVPGMPGIPTNPSAAKVFGGLTDDALATQMEALLARRPALLAAAKDAPEVAAMLGKRLDRFEELLQSLKAGPKIAADADALASTLAGIKGDVAKLKAALAAADDLAAKAIASGAPEALAAATKAQTEAKTLLQAKQQANVVASKKASAKKKLEAAQALARSGDEAGLKAALTKLQSAAADADVAGAAAQAVKQQIVQQMAKAEQALKAGAAEVVAIKQAAAQVVDALPGAKGDIAAMKTLLGQAEGTAKWAAQVGSHEAAEAVEAAVDAVKNALAAKQQANKVSSTKAAIKKGLTGTEGLSGASKSAKAHALQLKLDAIAGEISPAEAKALQQQIDALAHGAPMPPAAPAAPSQVGAPPQIPAHLQTTAQSSAETAAAQALTYAKSGTTSYYLPKTAQQAADALQAATASGNAYAAHVAQEALDLATTKAQLVAKTLSASASPAAEHAAAQLVASIQAKLASSPSASVLQEALGVLEHLAQTAPVPLKNDAAAAAALVKKKISPPTLKPVTAPTGVGKGVGTVTTYPNTYAPAIDAVVPHAGAHRQWTVKTDAMAWGKSRFAPWAAEVKTSHVTAIKYYKSSGYTDLNGFLRTGVGSAKARTYVKSLDDILSRASAAMPENVMAFRGTQFKEWFDMTGADVGKLITDKGYMSASLIRSVSHDWASYGPHHVLLEIRVPKGTKLPYLDAKSGLPNVQEYEVLIGRGAQLRLTGIRTDFVTTWGGQVRETRVLEVVLEGFAPTPVP